MPLNSQKTESLVPSTDPEVLAASVVKQFSELWGERPALLAVAPGRVNLIGEHVDYNGGWVLPAAIDRQIMLAVRPRTDRRVRLAAAEFPEPVEFGLDELEPGEGRHWSRYVRGVLAGLAEAGITLQGFDGFVDSTIPVGGGLSSSAALEAVAGLAALALAGETMDRFALAKICQHAEHVYAGVPCGIMDQAAVLNCRQDHLLLLDCETEAIEQAPFSLPDWTLMIIDTRVAHELASGEYGKRRAACHKAAETLGVPTLRHLAAEQLDATLANPALSEEEIRCVRHVVTENARTHATVEALRAGDVATAGTLLYGSHESLRDDYRVSCAELDLVVEASRSVDGVAGCRMTGGGFGGSCIALVRRDAVETVAEQLSAAFQAAFDKAPSIFVTTAAQGAELHRAGEGLLAD